MPPGTPEKNLGSEWTTETWRQHSLAQLRWDAERQRLVFMHQKEMQNANRRFDAERDRRYAEVNIEKEKALKIKEEADKAALGLAREIQTYKDEKANELREQISSERGNYATKSDLQGAVEKLEARIGPIATWVSSQTGKGQGAAQLWALIAGVILLLVAIVGLVMKAFMP